MSENRCCCNCRHDIRTGEAGNIENHCEIDGHYIGYCECFEGWCKHWAKEHKWESEVTENETNNTIRKRNCP